MRNYAHLIGTAVPSVGDMGRVLAYGPVDKPEGGSLPCVKVPGTPSQGSIVPTPCMDAVRLRLTGVRPRRVDSVNHVYYFL